MKRRLCVLIFIFMLGMILSPAHIEAQNNADIIEVMNEETVIHLFISGMEGDVNKADCYISSLPAEEIEYSRVGSAEIPIKTLFLIDGSLSIKEEERKHYNELLKLLIDGKKDYESYAIATFGEKLNYVCEFTSDRYELTKKVDSIEYKKQKSYLKDAINYAIQEFEKSGDLSYKRIIVFSDGGDDNIASISTSELSAILQDTPYPIYTIGCQYETNNDELKDLFTISRISKAEAFLFTGETDLDSIIEAFAAVKNNIVLKIKLPDSVRDGGIKNFEVSIGTSVSDYTASRDIRVSMFKKEEAAINEQNTAEAEQEQQPDAGTDLQNSSKDLGSDAENDIQDTMENTQKIEVTIKDKHSPDGMVYIITAGAGVLLIALILIFIFINRRKPKKPDETSAAAEPIQAAGGEINNTMLFTDKEPALKEDTGTQLLFGKSIVWNLQLKDVNSNRVFAKEFKEEVFIGRDAQMNNITINYDPSISKKHCRIFKNNDQLFIEDLKSSNGTYVNDVMINGNAIAIQSGDIIKLGKLRLEVKIGVN